LKPLVIIYSDGEALFPPQSIYAKSRSYNDYQIFKTSPVNIGGALLVKEKHPFKMASALPYGFDFSFEID
jgi:hypothetical protein